MATASAATANRVLTVPNVITLVRLALVPVFLWLLFGADDWLAAGLLLGGLGATDWVDGYVARRYNQVSELGKMLDPIADRVAVHRLRRRHHHRRGCPALVLDPGRGARGRRRAPSPPSSRCGA